jgi:hypothetical protein
MSKYTDFCSRICIKPTVQHICQNAIGVTQTAFHERQNKGLISEYKIRC